jgi:hypothetical protein
VPFDVSVDVVLRWLRCQRDLNFRLFWQSIVDVRHTFERLVCKSLFLKEEKNHTLTDGAFLQIKGQFCRNKLSWHQDCLVNFRARILAWILAKQFSCQKKLASRLPCQNPCQKKLASGLLCQKTCQ